jgi:protein TonB
MVPSFQQGDSAVALTLIASPPSPTATPESMEPVLTRPGSDIKIDLDKPEAAKKPEPSPESNDADALTKGVESSLQPLSGIRPVYPLGSRIRGEEGVVTLKALVDGEGWAVTVAVVDSSGYAALDNAAVQALQKTRFVSARKDGRADEGKTTVRIRFRLTD